MSKVSLHFDKISNDYDFYKKKNSYYYENIKNILREFIPPGKNVLEVGCGTGDLLATLNPKNGYGIDISSQMIKRAKLKYTGNKNIIYSTKWPKNKFNYIFMSDVIEHLENPEEVFDNIRSLMDRETLFLITMANPLWEPLLMFAEKLRLKMPEGPHKRISTLELFILLEKTGMSVIKHDYRLLLPVRVPLVSKIMNDYLYKYFKKLCFLEYTVARFI